MTNKDLLSIQHNLNQDDKAKTNTHLLECLWEAHDKMERLIIKLERKFTDKQLDEMLER